MPRVVSKIGQAAGVLVDQQRNKYATAQDLRRSFGERWASRVMPQVLMELMRHESIDTTLKYYVGRNAQRTSKILKDAYEKLESPLGSEGGDSFRALLKSKVMQDCGERNIPAPPMGFGMEGAVGEALVFRRGITTSAENTHPESRAEVV